MKAKRKFIYPEQPSALASTEAEVSHGKIAEPSQKTNSTNKPKNQNPPQDKSLPTAEIGLRRLVNFVKHQFKEIKTKNDTELQKRQCAILAYQKAKKSGT